MKNKETIDTLNMLVEINNNRIDGYDTASKHHNDEDTKNILFQLMETCKNCKTELISEILQLGGIPSKAITGTGWFLKLLVSVRNVLRKDIQTSTLNACLYREGIAIATYNKILEKSSGYIPADMTDLLITQYISIQKNHSDVKSLQRKHLL